MRLAASLLLLLILVLPVRAQVNGQLQVIDGKPILTVWGTHAERGYAQGYLRGAEGKEVFDNYVVGYFCGGSATNYWVMRSYFTGNFEVDAEYVSEAESVIEGMTDAGVSLHNSTLARAIDATDILVSNAIVDMTALAAARDPFACSSMSNWGASTATDPLLDGHLVVTRLLDWSKHPTLTANPLLTVHLPSEPDEQPWISIGYAGMFGALSAVSESGVSATLNMGNNGSGSGGAPYHPILLSVRSGMETADYDGDGQHTPSDVTTAIGDRARNIDTIVHVTKDAGAGSRPIIVESNNAAGVAVRDQSHNTLVPGDNLVATNHFRLLYSPVYCYRYQGIVDSLNVSTSMSCERSWDIMAGAAGVAGSNIQCIQYVESEGLLLWSMDTPTEPAYSQPPTVLQVEDLFGCQLGVEDELGRLSLLQNSPNPFRPATEIAYSLAEPAHCRLTVYDVGGRIVKTLVDGVRGAGLHSVRWDGRADGGQEAATGVYLYRLEAGGRSGQRKMLLLR